MVWEFAFVLLKLLSGFVKSILSILYSNNIDFSLLKNVNFINIFFLRCLCTSMLLHVKVKLK